MNCAKAQRELLWLSRFGELGPSSQPHLDHLAGCHGCRDEVGLDRAIVQQLRIALAERVENARPSPHAWETILERAQVPEPPRSRLWAWSGGLVARLRFATAMAGTGLAVMLALNMEVIPVPAPTPDPDRAVEAALQQVPRMPTGRTSLIPYTRDNPDTPVGATRPDPEATLTGASARQPVRPAAPEEPLGSDGAEEVTLRVVFLVQQTPEPAAAARSADGPGIGASESPPPSQAGVPS
jgi:hypothetical protein